MCTALAGRALLRRACALVMRSVGLGAARELMAPLKPLRSVTMIRVVADCSLHRGTCALLFYGLSFCSHFWFKLNLRRASLHYKRNLRL